MVNHLCGRKRDVGIMKDYAEWAAEQIEKDYPGYSWDYYMYLVTETRICQSVERYGIKKYMEGKNE